MMNLRVLSRIFRPLRPFVPGIRRPRRFLFICLACACLWLLYYGKNSHDLELQMSSNFGSLSSELLQKTNKDQQSTLTAKFVKIDKMDLPFYGDMTTEDMPDGYHLTCSVNEAMKVCQDAADQCKGFLYHNATQSAYFKSGIAQGIYHGELAFYVKEPYNKEYYDELTFLECAVPHQDLHLKNTGCVLPVLDPYDKSVMKFMDDSGPIVCPGRKFTTFKNHILTLVPEQLEGVDVKSVSYQLVLWQDDDKSKLSDPINLSEPTLIKHDFVIATAELSNGQKIQDYHLKVFPKEEVLQRTPKQGVPMNVIMIIIESMSHAHFVRMFPKVVDYLKNELGSSIFKGYGITGEGTTPSMTSLFTGKSIEENCKDSEGRRRFENTDYIDKWPFIFKNFKDHGYATMYTEDDAYTGIFSFRLKGFQTPPVDHYGKTYWQAVYPLNKNPHCAGPRISYQQQFEYMKSFLDEYGELPKLAITFQAALSHHGLTVAHAAQDNILNYLKSLKAEGHLDNSMLFVMGDHGPRYGEIRWTSQGRMEERLPFLSVTTPPKFQEKFPSWKTNLEMNSELLTSPQDIHATLLHILNYPEMKGLNDVTRGMSLFNPLPKQRTCADAGIPDQFCPCMVWKDIDIDHPHVKASASALVKYMNNLLQADEDGETLCTALEFKNVIKAYQMMPSNKVSTFQKLKGIIGLGIGDAKFDDKAWVTECSYQIQIQTIPNSGKYEAMVHVRASGGQVYGQISRLDEYLHQADCLAQWKPHLRIFCNCKI